MDPDKPNPLEALWQAHALVGVLVAGEALALVLALAPGAGGDRWVYFGLASLAIQWISFLALGGLYLLRGVLGNLPMQRVAWIALGILMASTSAVGSAAWLLLRQTWPMAQDAWPSFLFRLASITLVLGLFGLVVFQNQWRARQLSLRAKQAELESLQARIRPHFLFNTLNTAIALVRQRPAAVEELLLDLADLFRAALSGPRAIPLSDELALTRRYLEIESLRFGDRLSVEWSLPGMLPTIDVPALSIQPLAENAIRHGIEPNASGGVVDISVVVDKAEVRITIGNGIAGETDGNRAGHHIGLNSARERIRAATAGRGSITTRIDGNRHVAEMVIPLDSAQATIS
jgi:two-component system sensor histidine kinase AlgZ